MTCSPCAPRPSRRSRSTRRSSAAAPSISGRRLLLALAVLGLALAAGAAAHDRGTIRVNADFFKDGSYEVDVIVDRQHLPPGFGTTLSARPYEHIENLTPELDREVGALIAGAINGAHIAFDGQTVRPTYVELVLP